MRPEADRPDVDGLLELLWRAPPSAPRPREPEETQVFAVLDAARFPRLPDALRRSRLDYRCLYDGELTPALARAAPYVVSLGRRSAGTRQLLEAVWGRRRGLFLRSPALLQEVRRQLLRWRQVEDPLGRSHFFRFYDPAVLPLFLPTCTREELAFLFGSPLSGPQGSFDLELDGGRRLLRYRLRDDLLWEEIFDLADPQAPPVSANVVGGDLRGPDPARRAPRHFRLRQPQWDVLRGDARRRYVERVLVTVARCWPRTYRSRGEAVLRSQIVQALDHCAGYGIRGRREVMHFVNLQLSLGADFHRRPWATRILENPRLEGPVKISLLLPQARRALAAETGR